jgi:hypothetical protein
MYALLVEPEKYNGSATFQVSVARFYWRIGTDSCLVFPSPCRCYLHPRCLILDCTGILLRIHFGSNLRGLSSDSQGERIFVLRNVVSLAVRNSSVRKFT